MTPQPRPFTLGMEHVNTALEQLRAAPFGEQGRASRVLLRERGHSVLLIALAAGGRLPEHQAPGAITVLVLEGRIVFTARQQRFEASAHDLISLEAQQPHSLEALEDSAVLVTITTLQPASD